MNRNDIDRYKQELMDMYGKKRTEENEEQSKPESTEKSTAASETDNADKKDRGEDNESAPAEDGDDDIEKRFPPPVIPDFIKAAPPPLPLQDSFGFLKVSVRTGRGGLPIGGNPVMISKTDDNGESLVRMLMTDQSGDTETIKLPTYKNPDGTQPDDYKAAAEYNISVGSEGYFSEQSRGVSIFDGITSVQTFYLVPEPFDYTTDDTVVFDNPEPEV